ncbi:hypothetical protein [Geminocystis sp. GBBB08]|uniref:hypothetical protein n=1 Tax=Geminocystis sp. GBBB08 TaxID=2604140 RepID=UPI0027E3AC97|nr:hypothetical protein [Geminocystis sp. GBBB08]MBL1208527.1 hypothetical protein [Geminocystis sp. GBBB08]
MSIQADEKPLINESVTDENQNLIDKLKVFFASWRFKVTAVISVLMMSLLLVFYWQHIIAVTGMRIWVNHADAKAIDCMVRDTNDDEYISCTAMMNEQVVPLECGTSILNIGCRVNYGSASPSFKGLGVKGSR